MYSQIDNMQEANHVTHCARASGAEEVRPAPATLTERLGTDRAAALWVRAERRLDGPLKTTEGLNKEERMHVEGYIMPTRTLTSWNAPINA